MTKPVDKLEMVTEIGNPEDTAFTVVVHVPKHWKVADAVMLGSQIDLLMKVKEKQLEQDSKDGEG